MGKSDWSGLIEFNKLLRNYKGSTIIGGLGLGGGIRTLFIPTSIISEKSRAIKSRDLWILSREYENGIIAKNRANQKEIKIPDNVLLRTLRRVTGLRKIDITKNLDWIVIDKFREIKSFLNPEDYQRFLINLKQWQRFAMSRQCHLMIPRKLDLGAPGTIHLAYYSDINVVPAEMWGVPGINTQNAKILSLWFNSTPHLIQFFLGRTETRGTWMKFDLSMIKRCLVFDPRSINEKSKEKLLKIFKETSNEQFPSLIDQLRRSYDRRHELDVAILTTLGFGNNESKDLTEQMTNIMYDELSRLQELMKG